MKSHPRLVQAAHYGTWILGTRFKHLVELVFVVGYPKSGTTWACQLVSDCLQIPFPRFSILPVGCRAVVHGHERVWKSYPRGIYVMRDGRDALVSKYFMYLRGIPEGKHPQLTREQRRLFPGLVHKSDHRANLFGFVARQLRKPASARVNWGRHVQSYFESNHPRMGLVRYEDLLGNGATTLANAIAAMGHDVPGLERAAYSIERFSFARQSGRMPGHSDDESFLRKGQRGDWHNHFSLATAQLFDDACGDVLIEAGYEENHDWVARCPG